MKGESEELKERLAQAGWSVTDLRENVLNIQGKVMDVTLGAASRGHLRGHFVRLGQCVDGDSVDRFAGLADEAFTVARRVGGTKFRAEVLDTDRALEELAHLEPVLRAHDFSAALALVEGRGFSVDRLASREDTYDTFVWQIRARRAGEHLDVGMLLKHHGLAEQGPGDLVKPYGEVELRRPDAVLSIAVRSFARAEELLDVLALPRTP